MVDDVSLNTLRRFTPILAAGEEAALLAACDQGLPVCIAANTLRCTPTALHERLLAQGVRLDPLSWHPAAFRWPEDAPTPGKFLEFVAGLYWVQEEAAMLPVRLLDPRPGERILDLCAAPGNKTAQIALALEGRGVLVANDRVPSRMRSLGATLDRLGPLVVSRTMLDGRRFPTQAEPFDRVLVDAPCTCLGTSRKSRRILRRWTQRGTLALVSLQRALLARAVEVTRPGGRIVYATCTYPPEENEAVIDWLLSHREDVHLIPAKVDGFVSRPALTRWRQHTYRDTLRHAMRVWPHDNDTGGFFCAVLERDA